MNDADIEYLNRNVEASRLIEAFEVWYVDGSGAWLRVTGISKRFNEPGVCADLSNGTYVALYNATCRDFRIGYLIQDWPSLRGE